jgi:hypothetical protein
MRLSISCTLTADNWNRWLLTATEYRKLNRREVPVGKLRVIQFTTPGLASVTFRAQAVACALIPSELSRGVVN